MSPCSGVLPLHRFLLLLEAAWSWGWAQWVRESSRCLGLTDRETDAGAPCRGGLQMLKSQMPPRTRQAAPAIQASTPAMPSRCCSSREQGASIALGTWVGEAQRMEKRRGAASADQRWVLDLSLGGGPGTWRVPCCWGLLFSGRLHRKVELNSPSPWVSYKQKPPGLASS